MLCWSGGTIYFLYVAAKGLDSSLHYAPTNCTILDISRDSDDMVYMHANYTVPGNDYNYTSFMNNLDDNANYYIHETIPCFYALHDHSYVMAQVGIRAGIIVMIVFAIIMSIPVAIGAVFLLSIPVVIISPSILKLAKSTRALFQRNHDDAQDNCNTSAPSRSVGSFIHGYLAVPVVYCKAAFGSTVSWLMARFARNNSNKTQPLDAYALEDQGSIKTRASTGHSFRSTKNLLSHSKSQRSEMSDQSSVETRSL
jgi:hypothetical protein